MVFAFFLRRHSVFQEIISQVSLNSIPLASPREVLFFQGKLFLHCEGWKIGKVFELVLRYYIFSVCFYRFLIEWY